MLFFPPMAKQPLLGQDLLIVEAARSHSTTSHSVGLLWRGDQPDAEISTWQHTTHKRQTPMLAVGFEPTTPESEVPEAHALDRTAIGTGIRRGYTGYY
jgi:hypothetical protein